MLEAAGVEGENKVAEAPGGDLDCPAQFPAPLVPGPELMPSRGYCPKVERSVDVRLREVRPVTDHHHCTHLGVNVAIDPHHARPRERGAADFVPTIEPEVERTFLREREDVVIERIVIREGDGAASGNHHHAGRERLFLCRDLCPAGGKRPGGLEPDHGGTNVTGRLAALFLDDEFSGYRRGLRLGRARRNNDGHHESCGAPPMDGHESYTSGRPRQRQHDRRGRRWPAIIPAGALLGACAASPPEPAPDLVLLAGRVVTLDAAGPEVQAVAVAAGTVVEVGGRELATRWPGRARVVDLGPAVLAPALVDHHIHLYNVGLTLLNDQSSQRLFLDLSDATSVEEIAARVRRRRDGLLPGQWILGAGWSQAAWGTEALPSHHPLSLAAPDHPVFLARVDGHAGWVNRRALELAALWFPGSDPPSGEVIRTAAGLPAGVLLERANEPVLRQIQEPSFDDAVAAFRLATRALAARGVVEVYDAGALAVPGVVALNADLGRPLAALRRADAAEPVPLIVNLMIPAPSALADSLLAAERIEPISPRIRITHLKLFADGALGSRGAALTHPYADDSSTRGVARMTTPEILALARRALDRGLGVATHAIGDEAVRRTLDAYEQLLGERPRLAPGRLRIEHFSYAREEDIARAVRLGVVLSVQSNFNARASDAPTFAARRVGAGNEPRVYAWDRLHRLGAKLAEGSDYFTRPGPAAAGFLASLVRKGSVGERRAGPEARPLAWRLNATLWEADGHPRDPTIRPGGTADLVVLSDDPLTAPLEVVDRLEVLATLRAGVVTYLSDRARPLFPDR